MYVWLGVTAFSWNLCRQTHRRNVSARGDLVVKRFDKRRFDKRRYRRGSISAGSFGLAVGISSGFGCAEVSDFTSDCGNVDSF